MNIVVYMNSFAESDVAALRESSGRHESAVVERAITDVEALRLAPEAEVLLGRITPEFLAVAPKLRWLQHAGAGMDKVLFPELVERDVVITNMAGLFGPQVAEQAWALLLGLTRGLGPSMVNQLASSWKQPPVIELTGGTLLILGMGGVGRHMARRASGYDMTILGVDPVVRQCPPGVAEMYSPGKESLHAALGRADAVMCACPLTPETHNLIGAAEFVAMRDSALLINVARGGIIDEAALIHALEHGQIAAAGLDVFEREPLPADDPLWQTPRLLITPHQAGNSQHRQATLSRFFSEQLDRYLSGTKLLNIVDKRRGF